MAAPGKFIQIACSESDTSWHVLALDADGKVHQLIAQNECNQHPGQLEHWCMLTQTRMQNPEGERNL
jgi:hypothetical protein